MAWHGVAQHESTQHDTQSQCARHSPVSHMLVVCDSA
jgi:hypothetical protein